MRCVITADVQLLSIHRIPTHTNGSKAIIIIGYHAITVVIELCGICACGQVQIASNLICLHAVSSLILMASLWLLWLLPNVVDYGSTITTMVCYYGIVEFSVRDKH